MNLAPPSGPGAGPNLPPPLNQPTLAQPGLTQPPPIASAPPTQPPPGTPAAGQAVLALTAKYGKDLPVIASGLVWRVFADKPDENGTFKLIREERGATPNIVLPPGNYVVHVALGLVSTTRAVTLKSDTDREAFILPAGGLRGPRHPAQPGQPGQPRPCRRLDRPPGRDAGSGTTRQPLTRRRCPVLQPWNKLLWTPCGKWE